MLLKKIYLYTYQFFSIGEALTYLTDRALAWQQRAEKVLRTAEVSEELKKLNDTEANGRKEKKTKGKILIGYPNFPTAI